MRRFGARVLERAESWHPPLAAELEAFALGARLEPELVAALNGRTELLALAECTTVGRCESADGPWLAQNWDWYADAPERCLVWSAAVEGARFATMTEAGILAKVGVSTRGIAVALNILYHASDGRGELGVPVHLVLRRLLEEAASVGDAWELLRETPYSASSCITVVDAARRRRVLRAVARRRRAHRAARRPARPHQPLPRRRRWRAARRNSRPSGCRARARVWRPRSVRRRASSPTRSRCSATTTSDPQAICRHDEPSGEPGRPLVDTVVSLAMRPGVPELRVAAGQPCECAFLRLRGLTGSVTARQAPPSAPRAAPPGSAHGLRRDRASRRGRSS